MTPAEQARRAVEEWQRATGERVVPLKADLIARLTPVYERAFAADKIEDERDKARDDCDDLRERVERAEFRVAGLEARAMAEAHDTAVAQRAREEEREACARVADGFAVGSITAYHCAAAIRARKESGQ